MPVGGVAIAGIILFLKAPPVAASSSIGVWERFKEFDPLGIATFLPSIICLLLALQLGGVNYAYSNVRIIILFILFGILLIAFIGLQFYRGEKATVPPRIMANRTMLGSALFAFCFGGSFFTVLYYLPIWFQAIKGTSATKSGIDNLPLLLGNTVMNVVSGALISRFGYYTPFMYLSVVFMSTGAGLFTTFTDTTGHAKWIGYQVIFGFGSGMGFQQPIIAAQTVLKLTDIPIGTATLLFIQLLGGAIFVSVGNNIFNTRLVKNLLRDVPNVNPQAIIAAGATNLRRVTTPQDFHGVQLAYNDAIIKTFQIALIVGCIGAIGAAFVEWRSVKAEQKEGAGGESGMVLAA